MIRNDYYPNPQNFYFNRNMFQANNPPIQQNPYVQNFHSNSYMMPYPPYQPQYQTFRPSPLIYTGLEELGGLPGSTVTSVTPTTISTSTTTSTTTTSTTTPSPPPSTTSVTTTTTSQHPLSEVASHNAPNKTIVISFTKNQQRQPVRSYIQVALVRPSFHRNFNPINHQKPIVHPASSHHHHISTINSNIKASFRLKRPNINSPFMMQKQRSNAQLTNQPSSVIILTPQVRLVTKSPHRLPSSATVIKDHNSAINISPLKKTETAPALSRSGPDSSKEINQVIYPTRHTILNQSSSGFHPGNIKIEEGFTPILERSDTMIYNGSENDNSLENSLIHNSPSFELYTKGKKSKRTIKRSQPNYFKVRVKFARDLRDVSEDHDAEESSNREIYYLPPDNQKHAPLSSISQPSNIDIIPEESDLDEETAPDVVVTYDGKRVSGASLTAKLADSMRTLNTKSLRTSEFIRTRPQSVPFKGELPPLDDLKPPELYQRATLNRNLDVPFLHDAGSNGRSKPASTKLSLVQNDSRKRTDREFRRKRSPHHTPEHTRQQNEEKSKDSSTTLVPCSLVLLVVLVQALLFI
ncbi:transcription initiation factor TFIID subunit 12-like [Coccinella septempunctata]|uniref:transcription initiation factor TFIID subunit 12-like n=1 Tax=Coccinella septempunctata TaxID=41139 RepID=UPI001D074E9C|nr:transcription initiation factor TFIID subunit 12-like [Coccinella septempunctata]